MSKQLFSLYEWENGNVILLFCLSTCKKRFAADVSGKKKDRSLQRRKFRLKLQFYLNIRHHMRFLRLIRISISIKNDFFSINSLATLSCYFLYSNLYFYSYKIVRRANILKTLYHIPYIYYITYLVYTHIF